MFKTFKLQEDGGYGRPQSLYGKVVRAARNEKHYVNNLHFRRERMKIKFEKAEEIEVGQNRKFKMIQVTGEALSGKNAGNESKTKFFKNNKELKAQVDELVKGDIVEVTMVKNGNYWNPTKYEKVGQSTGDGGAPTTQGSCTCTSDPRRENLEVAVEILGPKPPDMDSFTYLESAAQLADMVNDYILEAGAFQFKKDTSEDIPEMEDE